MRLVWVCFVSVSVLFRIIFALLFSSLVVCVYACAMCVCECGWTPSALPIHITKASTATDLKYFSFRSCCCCTFFAISLMLLLSSICLFANKLCCWWLFRMGIARAAKQRALCAYVSVCVCEQANVFYISFRCEYMIWLFLLAILCLSRSLFFSVDSKRVCLPVRLCVRMFMCMCSLFGCLVFLLAF